jgi:fumarate hydratase class II
MAAAKVNARLGVLDTEVADAVVAAAQEVIEGRHMQAFVLPVVQGGGGTSTNMNVNEVLAHRASQILGGRGVHPNDDVNRSQSTNDVLPTALAVTLVPMTNAALESLSRVCDSLQGKAAEYAGLVHLGRTCLQDAVPIPVSDVHEAQAAAVDFAAAALRESGVPLRQVPLGGTAVGTGLGAPPGFGVQAVRELSGIVGFELTCAPSPTFLLGSLEPAVRVIEAAAGAGRALARVGSDLRLLASGPGAGIGEVALPKMQAGSSIMPGKVNPVIPELVMQVSYQLEGSAASARAATVVGELEVTAMGPVVTLAALESLQRLTGVAEILVERCLTGLRWRTDAVRANLASSLESAVAAAGELGYDVAAAQIHGGHPNGMPPAVPGAGESVP